MPPTCVTLCIGACCPTATEQLAALWDEGGDAVAGAFIDWVCTTVGTTGPLVASLLRAGAIDRLVPLALASGLVATLNRTGVADATSLARLEHHWKTGERLAAATPHVLSEHAAHVIDTALAAGDHDVVRGALAEFDAYL